MRDAPEALSLLHIAEATIKKTLVPALSGERKYEALMAANAIRIAIRQVRDPEGHAAAERAALQRLTGRDDEDLEALNAAFAAGLREGRYDPGTGQHAAAARALLSQTVARLAEVNPGALEAERENGAVPKGFRPWEDGA